MNSYDIGNTVTLQCNVYEQGVLVDPVSISIIVKPPGTNSSTFAPTRISTGVYTYTLSLASAGTYQFRWTTSNPTAAANGQIQSIPSPI